MADIVNPISTVGGMMIPGKTFTGLQWATVFIVGLVLAIIVGVFLWHMLITRKFNSKVFIWKKRGSESYIDFIDEGGFERISNEGDYVFILRKARRVPQKPKLHVGFMTKKVFGFIPRQQKVYFYIERLDGELVNFSIGDIDAIFKKAGVFYIDEDMRMYRLAIARNMKARFDREPMWQKYGPMLGFTAFILVTLICLIVLFREMRANWEIARSMSQAVYEMAKSVANMAQTVGGKMQPVG